MAIDCLVESNRNRSETRRGDGFGGVVLLAVRCCAEGREQRDSPVLRAEWKGVQVGRVSESGGDWPKRLSGPLFRGEIVTELAVVGESARGPGGQARGAGPGLVGAGAPGGLPSKQWSGPRADRAGPRSTEAVETSLMCSGCSALCQLFGRHLHLAKKVESSQVEMRLDCSSQSKGREAKKEQETSCSSFP